MAMVVACTQCGAQYEFDASAIPAAGYDAQCSHCEALFFVRPEITVTCNNCMAAYQFSPLDIPPEGYDAQCTQCQSIFFVSAAPPPAADAAAEPVSTIAEPSGLSAVSATEHAPGETESTMVTAMDPAQSQPDAAHAGPASFSPAEALTAPPLDPEDPDVFTVSQPALFDGPGTAAEPPAGPSPEFLPPLMTGGLLEPSSAAPPGPEPDELPMLTDSAFRTDGAAVTDPSVDGPPVSQAEMPLAPVAVAADKSVLAPAAQGESVAGPVAAAIDAGGVLASDDPFMSLNEELGEPASAPVTAEQDFEGMLRRVRARRRLLIALVALVPIGVAVTFVAAPRIFDSTIGGLVGIKALTPQAAIEQTDRGRRLMEKDTDAAYGEALGHFAAALKLDPNYDRALVLSALALAFRGKDLRDRGSIRRSLSLKLHAELEDLTKRNAAKTKNRMEKLRQQRDEITVEAQQLFDQGGDHIQEGQKRLSRALVAGQGSPLVVTAAGIFELVRDVEGVGKARNRQLRGLRLRGLRKLDPAAPPDVWAPYLAGQILEAEGLSAAVMWRSVLKRSPSFHRARYRLALELHRAGKSSETSEVAQGIVDQVQGHEKALALLGAGPEAGN